MCLLTQLPEKRNDSLHSCLWVQFVRPNPQPNQTQLTPWPSMSMNSVNVFLFLGFCRFGPTTQPNPKGWPNPWTTLIHWLNWLHIQVITTATSNAVALSYSPVFFTERTTDAWVCLPTGECRVHLDEVTWNRALKYGDVYGDEKEWSTTSISVNLSVHMSQVYRSKDIRWWHALQYQQQGSIYTASVCPAMGDATVSADYVIITLMTNDQFADSGGPGMS